MRFSARKKYVKWSTDPIVDKAVNCLKELLATEASHVVRLKLSSGQGIVCNNVLHKRSAYNDDAAKPRVFYRLRSLNRLGVDSFGV